MPSIETTTVYEWENGSSRAVLDDLAGEDPLEIRVGGHPVSITMRTPGHDLELAAGFLVSEGVVSSASLRRLVQPPGRSNVVHAHVDEAEAFDPARLRRHFYASSSCGVCGRASLESLRARSLPRPAHAVAIDPDTLCRLPGRLREEQRVFSRTGGLHAAGLFDAGGRLLLLREDIGRHNAVDKVIGHAVLGGALPLSGRVLLVSGRGGFEIAQKAVAAGIEILACVSAPSSLAVELAREFGLTLVGFLRDRRFVVYAGQERIRGSFPC